ncbi:MAG: YdeI/OmpD-associated family protein [Bacteroidales bacterium]|nr:YdeI/OmpD-associated family protein [Lentimicrobiaceae bacterium]MDD5695584.1 YdeI/OmpD-associated family protein [Bacteroidales bacterium]
MASFKQHCAFTIWLASQMQDPHGILTTGTDRPAMGNLGKITCLEDLPSDPILIGYLRDAVELIEKGTKLVKKETASKSKELVIPDYLQHELALHPKALQTFNQFSYSNKKEYVEWIKDAKTEETRRRRLATAIDWLTEGKPHNWKYLK